MRKVVALFGSQVEASQAVDALAQWKVRTEVIETTDSVDLLGEGGSVAVAPPSSGSTLAPPAFPVDPSNPFADADFGSLGDEEVAFLAERVRRGGVVVIIDAADEVADQVRAVVKQNNAQLYEAG